MVQRQLESDGAVNVINMKRRKWLKRERFMNFGDVYSDKVDRISQLPEPIIHHILSLLPTEDAVCTNVLSKTWRRIWSTFPVFDFRLVDGKYFDKHGIEDWDAETSKDDFLSFVEESLKRRLVQDFSIDKFQMHILFGSLKSLTPWMDRWLTIVTERNVKELDLNVGCAGTRIYSLPAIVLGAKSIYVLRLSNCNLNLNVADGIIKFSHLRELNLREMHVDEWMIQTFTSSCPFIESLELGSCHGLDSLCLPSSLLQLSKVVLRDCYGLKIVLIEAPNLIHFYIRNASSVPCEINLVACSKSLRKLSLLSATMTEEEFQNLMSLTPGVEVLELYYLGRCSRIMISSQNLKRLVLKACKKWLVAEIDTPNLLSVEHTCYQRYLSFNYINAAHLREVDLEFCLASHDIGWFSKLKEFLTSFAHSENFSMVVLCSKNVSIHAKLREILLLPLYTLMDLNPQVIISSKTFTELVDRVFDRFHPDTLSLISMCSCRKYLEFLYESLVEQEDHCEDFRSRRNHWRHFLGGFEIENLEGVEENRTSPWKAFLKSYLTVAYWTVALKLEWKCTKMYKSSGVMF
ncbi:putative F-box/LRR-repeat protein At3g28410 isoform X1 [Rhododendron vialii]|uniref:putative F-box/LRR-repeat protein At3g28410 isoform X1 n=1 Tax=Rhododendron vialii TaxID=182163 RepID=UPI0026605345|nr:putative F-box/LRR-repeat protein At3g28410 isoform X1 [Rhododendron vialii]XP_058204368.1 putative F-box/LRR-repeat protein At3g28410 isoform X1 [Rhododendron vialii]